MSRKQTRARKRCARFEAEMQDLAARAVAPQDQANRIETVDQIVKLLQRINASDVTVWPFVTQLEAGVPAAKYALEEFAAVRALIAQIVAPQLAGMTPGSVHRRHERPRRSRRAGKPRRLIA